LGFRLIQGFWHMGQLFMSRESLARPDESNLAVIPGS